MGSSDALRLYAIDSETGQEIWNFRTGGYAWSSPTVADGVAYIGSMSQYYLYAVDVHTGEAKWHLKVEDASSSDPYIVGVVSSPVVADGVTYYGSLDGNLYAVRVAF